ncbi:hypothetical protein JYU34_013453 [Plutella xylostella]|uniref:Elongation of very long chain fatty acids protein n=1 Tax=Plutella xylostella TaxID=51655 RepID=A0ABQ7QDI0_PLUXY|nr:hypothetical protein JYU34_013453 [Plutella xylostella]
MSSYCVLLTDTKTAFDEAGIAFIVFVYLLFTLRIGPRFMRNKSPWAPVEAIFFFNIIKLVHACFLTKYFYFYIDKMGIFPQECLDHVQSNIDCVYYRLMLVKMLDLCDTMYLILRNEFHQVTFSHVYRRLMMLFITWVCLKYDGTSVLWAFVGMVHSALLVPMYLADALVIVGPRAARFAWWRKYFPAVYMAQFLIFLLHTGCLSVELGCPRSRALMGAVAAHGAGFLMLYCLYWRYCRTLRARGEDEII